MGVYPEGGLNRISKLSNPDRKRLGIVVNPMSGRDVRRVVARASTSGHHEKQQQVTRLVLGAFAQGVEEIFLANEPFRINSRAVENLPQRDQVTLLEFPLTHSAADTETMVLKMWDAGCRVFIVLGGDGTNRIVAKTLPDSIILPLSTGTNNVFPTFVEASIAGAAAGLIASGKMSYQEHCIRCKQIHVCQQMDSALQSSANPSADQRDLALIDAVLLENDQVGSLLPFKAENISTVLLTRAEPASVGVSPIGGYLLPSHHRDDFGVFIKCKAADAGGPDGKTITVPISPGLYDKVHVQHIQKTKLDEKVTMTGPGILALDGDRTISLGNQEQATLVVRRDGPWIIETPFVMNSAAELGLFVVPAP
jgi:hypothetical protein